MKRSEVKAKYEDNMPEKLNVENDAPWKQRYRAPSIGSAQIAALCPTRAILNDTRSGSLQWYAWDIPSNQRYQISDTPGGISTDMFIAPDGQWVYYLQDKQGNEIGHYVRMPFYGVSRKTSPQAFRCIPPMAFQSAAQATVLA